RAERRREVDARQDRGRARARHSRTGRGRGRPCRLSRCAGGARLPRRALSLPGLVHGRRGARPPPAAGALRRRCRRAEAAARARVRPRGDPPRRGGRRRRLSLRALSAPRGRARDRRGTAHGRGRHARGRGAPGRRSGRRRQARLRRSGPNVHAGGHVPGSGRGRSVVSAVLTIAGYGFREALRRKVFAVVVLLTAVFLVLFWLANHYVFTRLSTISPPADVNVDTRTFAGAFLLGLAMFATLFLGVVLAVFLTLGVVSGDAERGLLQPLVVRPIGRTTLLLSRFLGAAAVCSVYVLAVYGIALTI